MTEQPAHRFPAWQERTAKLLGTSALERLKAARVAVIGVGGVGGYAAEMLCRAGVGHLILVDADNVSPTNINRQIIASQSSVGKPKTILFAERFHDINPEANITAIQSFVNPDNIESIITADIDFVIDAIDTIAPKTALLAYCLRNGIKVISSMGAGGRTDVTKVTFADLWETREDGLARAVRQRLKKIGLKRKLRVVCSTEKPSASALIPLDEPNKRSSFGTTAEIPALFGIFLANHVIKSLSSTPSRNDSTPQHQ